MNQPYFIVVLAHSFHGRLRRIQIPYRAIYPVLIVAFILSLSLFGIVSSYLRMLWKVADYNNLRSEVVALRARYQRLEKQSKQTDQQLASLQLLANEVSLAYGIKQALEGPADLSAEARLVPSLSESFEQYNFLRTGVSRSRRSGLLRINATPAIWPVDGNLMSYFGRRTDPFSGDGAFHTGVDIAANAGTPVRSAGDGVVIHAEWSGNYGKLVVIDHGSDIETYYAHLSRINVVAGQSIRRGDTIGLSGGTGRVTSPHLHYEVRRGGAPVNPKAFLSSTLAQAPKPRDFFAGF